MRGAVAVVALVAGGCLLGGCGSRPASLARDLGAPVDVAEVADRPTGESTDAASGPYYAPDGALVCDVGGRIPTPPPIACDDGTGLMDCCPIQLGDPCDPCVLPRCHQACRYGMRETFRCHEFLGVGWQLARGDGIGIWGPCTADDRPLLVDGGPVTFAQLPCNDGTGRTNCCPPGSAAEVACVITDTFSPYTCVTPCEAGTTTELGCGAEGYFLPAPPMACGPDGGP
jgi:hypothetical protein